MWFGRVLLRWRTLIDLAEEANSREASWERLVLDVLTMK